MDASKLFPLDTRRTRSNGVKLRFKQQVQLDSSKVFFTNDMVCEWNKHPPTVIQRDTINSFKNKLNHHFLNQGIPDMNKLLDVPPAV